VKVSVQGAATRETRTERGRIALEDLPTGNYRLRFEREGFITLERELTARAGAPMDVKVTLEPAPEPPKPAPPPEPVAAPPPPPPPTVRADPVVLDISAYLEKNFVGRAPSKNSNLGCSTGGTATLMQFRDAVPEHAHADADEYLYVVAGSGAAKIGGAEQPLQPSVFVQIPRTVSHTLTVRGKTPLVVLSIKAGEACGTTPTVRPVQ
jgi:mannose-6-phosphate isomerase-like protein (cupin superfamily)